MIQSNDHHEGFREFMDTLTAYRKSRVLMCAHELGIFESLAFGSHNVTEICAQTGMDDRYGERFLDVLTHLGFLACQDGIYELSRFSRQFLVKGSPSYQGENLEFEKTLTQSWQHLSETLLQGKRVYNTAEKSPKEFHASLSLYIGAMDNAARIRASELWKKIKPGKDKGVILDAGAGSGAFLLSFLRCHPGWLGVFCDLPDVIYMAQNNHEFTGFTDRIEFVESDLLDARPIPVPKPVDLILCSNLIHCQGHRETHNMLSRLNTCLKPGGRLIIHDFFTDKGPRGALYDLHMMLNTYNGRTYTVDHIREMLEPFGISRAREFYLDSTSTAVVFSKNGP